MVGAGPYGIAVADHLRAANIDVSMVGEPMGSWQNSMPDGMFLKSEGFASNIAQPGKANSLREFALERGYAYGDYGFPIPIGLFRAYGVSLVERGGLHRPGAVTALERNGTRFTATLSTGDEVTARNVVLASGITGMAYVPQELRELWGDGVSHSSEHVTVSGLGRNVVIVGAGQSALELAALALEHGSSPQVLVRQEEVRWNPYPRRVRTLWQRIRGPRAPLGDGWKLLAYSHGAQYFRHVPYRRRMRIVRETLGPAGAWWLRDRLEPHRVLRLGHRVLAADHEAGRVKLRLAVGDGRTEEVYTDRVIAATGYRVDVRNLRFIGRELVARIAVRDGAPVLSPEFESSVPGLFFVGLPAAATFGPLMRFVCGSGVAALRVSRAVARQS